MFNCCLFFEALVKLRGDDDVDDEVAEMKEEAQKESSTQKVRHPNSQELMFREVRNLNLTSGSGNYNG